MIWKISLLCTIGVIGISIVLALLVDKVHGRKFFSPLTMMFGGVFVAGMILFYPIYFETYKSEFMGILKSLLASFYSTLDLFKVDNAFVVFWEAAQNLDGGLRIVYEIVGTVITIFAPVLTFGVVLSVFGNFLSYQKYLIHFFSDAYIFSELNEKSLALAESIRKSDDKCMLIFTNIYTKNDKELEKLCESAKVLGAVCFRKNLNNIQFQYHSSESTIHFVVIGKDETENVAKTLKLVDQYRDYSNVRIDVFAKKIESELLLKTADKGKIKIVRRINEVQMLVSGLLYETGHKIFECAIEQGEEKLIKAVVVGAGQYGMEMARTLPWFCQMPGYRFEMDLIDTAGDIRERFEMLCPELMSSKYNGAKIDGEPDYTIRVHEGIDVNASSFRKLLEQVGTPSYVFVCLGEDAQNVKTATDIRAFFATSQFQPRIQAVMYNSERKEALYYAKCNDNQNTQSYAIDFVGDMKELYSKETMFQSEVEAQGLQRHLKWGEESSFWMHEYNYRSSIASAIHYKMKLACKIPYADVQPENRPEKERNILRKLEHCRWSAYMRSEGYTYGAVRNDLAKKHPCLVPYRCLSEKDQAKDDV